MAALSQNQISLTVINAVRNGNLATLKRMIGKHGLSYSTAWANGYLLLLDAVKRNHYDICKYLLESGCPVNNEYSKPNSTPLNVAINNHNTEIVRLLLGRGASIAAKDLHLAVQRRELGIVELLVDAGADIDAQNGAGNTALIAATRAGDGFSVQFLLSKGAKINELSSGGSSPLHAAIATGRLHIFQQLLDKGAEVNIKNNSGCTPLHEALSCSNSLKYIDLLLEKGASTNIQSKNGKTALHIAIERTNLQAMRKLVENQADVNISDGLGKVPLHIATEMRSFDAVQYLLENGALVNAKCKLGYTPLDVALKFPIENIVDILLKYGGKVSGKYSPTPLLFAIKNSSSDLLDLALKDCPDITSGVNKFAFHPTIGRKNSEFVKKLCQYGFELAGENIDNRSLLQKSIVFGHESSAKDLIRLDVNLNITYLSETEELIPPLHFAIKYGRENIAKFLINFGVDINVKDTQAKAPIMYAVGHSRTAIVKLLIDHQVNLTENPEILAIPVKNRNLEIVELLLNGGACVNDKNKDGKTVIFYAVENSDTKMVKLLLNYKAKLTDAPALLTIAVKNNDLAMIELLLSRGVNIESKNSDGKTALIVATEIGNNKIVEFLINKGANVNAQGSDGRSALHIAIENKNVQVFDLLLKKGAFIDIKDNSNKTPLFMAASTTELTSYFDKLLINGASIHLKSYEGKSVLHAAIEAKNWEVMKVLVTNGAKLNVYSDNGESPLHSMLHAYRTLYYPRDRKPVEFLFNNGINLHEAINTKCNLGFTPLDRAYKCFDTKIADFLTSKGAKTSRQLNETPLLLAVNSGHAQLVDTALEDCPDTSNEIYRLAFYTAIAQKNDEIVEKLRKFGFSIIPKDVKNLKILADTIKNGYVEIFKEIVNLGVDPKLSYSFETEKTFTPLHFATKHSRDGIAKYLISLGVDINKKDENGKPPISYAAENGDLKIIKLLLSHKADVTETPEVLNCAVANGSIKLVKVILTKDVNINAEDSLGRTALHCTVLGQDDATQAKIAKLLLSKGANVNTKSKRVVDESENAYQNIFTTSRVHECLNNGSSVLHDAVRVGFSKLVDVLLQHKADVNIKDNDEETPLHISAREGHAEIATVLVNKGADVNATDRKYRLTPIFVAVYSNKPAVVKVLFKFGAKTKDESLLHVAATTGNIEMINNLIDLGFDIDSKDKNLYLYLYLQLILL